MSRVAKTTVLCLLLAGVTLGCGSAHHATDPPAPRIRLAPPPVPLDTARLLPMLLHRATVESWEQPVVMRPFTGQAVVVYVIDAAETVRYLSPDDLEALDLTVAEIHHRAVDNLNHRAKDMRFAPVQGGPVYLLGLDGYYDASLLLSPLAVAIVRRILGAEPAVCAAGRGAVLVTIWGDHPLDRLSTACEDAFGEQSHPVSSAILIPGAEPGSWRQATDQVTGPGRR